MRRVFMLAQKTSRKWESQVPACSQKCGGVSWESGRAHHTAHPGCMNYDV